MKIVTWDGYENYKNLSLFCKRVLQKKLHSVQETCNLIDPGKRSHPIDDFL